MAIDMIHEGFWGTLPFWPTPHACNQLTIHIYADVYLDVY